MIYFFQKLGFLLFGLIKGGVMRKFVITALAVLMLTATASAGPVINPMVADDPNGAMCRVGSIWYDGVDYWYCRFPGVPINLGH